MPEHGFIVHRFHLCSSFYKLLRLRWEFAGGFAPLYSFYYQTLYLLKKFGIDLWGYVNGILKGSRVFQQGEGISSMQNLFG